jgi:hypothetical protein
VDVLFCSKPLSFRKSFAIWIKKNYMGGVCSTDVGEEVHAGFWWGNLRERYHLEDPDVDGKAIIKWVFRNLDRRAWTGLIWLRRGTGCGPS